LAAIWHDECLLELEALVEYSGFRGRSTAYTEPQVIAEFADALMAFDAKREGGPTFEAGFSDGSKALHMRVYECDRAGHLAMHMHMTTDAPGGHRPEEIWRLDIELKTEAQSLVCFARELRELARTQSGEAFLWAAP
jgi:hypothetical protein